MYTYDTETVCLSGPAVLIQWALDDGPIHLHEVWLRPAQDTLTLIEQLMDKGTIGFNLAFDHFQLSKLYTTFSLLPDKSIIPAEHIDEIALLEKQAISGPCIKPRHCFDVMLHARKGPYQSTMDRKDIVIKRVPNALAWQLATYLDQHVVLPDIYFARYANPKQRWKVLDSDSKDFKNVVLKFAPSSALKALAQDALKITDVQYFSDVEVADKLWPLDNEFAPYALSISNPQAGWRGEKRKGKQVIHGYAWPALISHHIEHWHSHARARKYAEDDVRYTRELYKFFGSPPIDDVDSILACMVGSVRWHGYRVNTEGIKQLQLEAMQRLVSAKGNFKSPRVVKAYLSEVMNSTERLVIKDSAKGMILESISKWKKSTVCDSCSGLGCMRCEDGLIPSDELHPAAERAKEVIKYRKSTKEIELYDKLLLAGSRLHADFKVIGTKSSRMSGAGGLNAQGINHSKKVRSQFPLADEGFILCGGDFSGFEVVLMDAAYKDPDLRNDLLKTETCRECKGTGQNSKKPGALCKDCKGTGQARIKIHGLFGTFLFPPMTYDQIMATKGLPGEQDKYSRSKTGVFTVGYGGVDQTLVNKVGVPIEVASAALKRWADKYKVWGSERQKINDMFCSMRQPGGIGSKVEWHEPADYIESMFGFRRYFTLENQICKILFNLANDPPKEWMQLKVKVVRRDREQTACGAVRSALFACAFAMQAANMRAGANHVIQSSGATLTKELEKRIWDLQPTGISDWNVIPMNVHDEIMVPARPQFAETIEKIVEDFVEEIRPKVPLIDISWGSNFKSWADK